jgi:two-component system, OmpR family, sensor kinase
VSSGHPRQRWFGSRLAIRIYLLGLVQMALVAAGLFVVVRAARRSEPQIEVLHVVAQAVASTDGKLEEVISAVVHAEKALGTKVAVFDDVGRFVAGTPVEGPPPFLGPPPGPPPEGFPPRGDGRHPPPPPPFWDDEPPGPPPHRPDAVPIMLRDGRVWHVAFSARRSPPSLLPSLSATLALVLVIVGVSAWLTARSLADPLSHLSQAARSFGDGNLQARAALTRSDELGDVSAAFDEMAGRVTHALRAEKELLANVSHELRTPLQRIQVAIDLAAEGDAATARESLDEIAEDLAELVRIVEDVLSAARLSLQGTASAGAALPPLRAAPVGAASLLAKSESRFRSLHPSRPFEVEIQGELPELHIDAVLMRRAVDNLLDNAHKYSNDDSAPVTLAAHFAEGRVVIRVKDQGIGITDEDRAHLFEPFFRADRSRTRTSGGLGLGLLLAKRIVEAHGGTLSIESVPAVGTTAKIELPAAS